MTLIQSNCGANHSILFKISTLLEVLLPKKTRSFKKLTLSNVVMFYRQVCRQTTDFTPNVKINLNESNHSSIYSFDTNVS